MVKMFAARLVRVLTLLAPAALALQPHDAAAQTQGTQQQAVAAAAAMAPRQEPAATAPPRPLNFGAQQDKINAWTLGLAAGLIEGAPLRLASEMARVVDDGENLHVLPIVTRGPTENLNSLLYLRGVDLAIINSDSLEEYKIQLPEVRRHVTYLLNLFPSELHVFVRPEIQSLQDLAGRKVNFNTLGTAAAYSGPLMFSRLGIEIDKTFIPHPLALQQMKKGESDIAAVVFVTSKPVDAFIRGQWGPGFKFLPVTYDARFEDYYLPASLEAAEYPNLIKPGERIPTIAVPTALVSYNWPGGSNRYQRVTRFTDSLFGRIDKLQVAGFDPKWKTINLRATVPGLSRFPPAQEWLDRQARKTAEKQ
jgi:TRAP-type uncharacterized transport system substrate-binding protein